MSQLSSSNGVKRSSSPSVVSARPKDVGKEEALQMEAEALAKLRKEKPVGCQESLQMLSNSRPIVPNFIRPDHDLMAFPESELKKKDDDKLLSIDIDKLTNAELEKILLDDSFESCKTLKPPALTVAPILTSLSSQYYTPPPYQGGQWTQRFRGPVSCTLPPAYSSTFPKQVDPFHNGFPRSLSTYRSGDPVYLSLPGQTPYMPFSLQPITPFHARGNLPTYSPAVTPSMAKLLDKIAVTSEFQKNGKMPTVTAPFTSLDPFPTGESPKLSSEINKFDWLDLDPLSKPKVENYDIPHHSVDVDGKNICTLLAEDPWDAVLSEEKPLEPLPHERQLSGKSPSGTSVTRSQSLNIRLTQSQLTTQLQSQSSQVGNGNESTTSGNRFLQEIGELNEEVAAFCQEVTKLRNNFPSSNCSLNSGFLLSPVMLERNISEENAAVKVSIEIEGFQQPVTFTCDVSSPVELIIMQALCWVHDDLNQIDIGSYILKVCGQEEVLQNIGMCLEDADQQLEFPSLSAEIINC